MSRAVPMCLPVLSALMKSSSVQTPLRNPVRVSGVRFDAKDTPHGPLHAVRSAVVAASHGLSGARVYGDPTLMDSG